MTRHSVTRPPRIEGDVAYIPLLRGYEAIIDVADLPLIGPRGWNTRVARRRDGAIINIYATQNSLGGVGRPGCIYMHRVIMGDPDGLVIDHIDGDGLNNRRSNLRTATQAQNSRNRRFVRQTASGFKGVCWNSRTSRWRARVVLDGKTTWLGSYETVEMAAEAYAEGAKLIHGEFWRAG